MDWKNKDEVLAYAARLGPTVVVVKHHGRDNYNIVHKDRTDLYAPSMIVSK